MTVSEPASRNLLGLIDNPPSACRYPPIPSRRPSSNEKARQGLLLRAGNTSRRGAGVRSAELECGQSSMARLNRGGACGYALHAVEWECKSAIGGVPGTCITSQPRAQNAPSSSSSRIPPAAISTLKHAHLKHDSRCDATPRLLSARALSSSPSAVLSSASRVDDKAEQLNWSQSSDRHRVSPCVEPSLTSLHRPLTIPNV